VRPALVLVLVNGLAAAPATASSDAAAGAAVTPPGAGETGDATPPTGDATPLLPRALVEAARLPEADFLLVPPDTLRNAICSNEPLKARTEAAALAATSASGATREQYRAAQRSAFRERLRAVYHHLALVQLEGLAPLLAIAGTGAPARPASCPALESGATTATWADLSARHDALQQSIEALSRDRLAGGDTTRAYFAGLLRATYEARLIEDFFLDGTWRKELWPAGGAAAGLKSLPYRAGDSSPRFIGPEEKLQEIYGTYPVLRKPARQLLGYPLETVGQRLFRLIFLPGDPDGCVSCLLTSDLRPHIEAHLARLQDDPAVSSHPVLSGLPEDHALNRLSDAEKRHFLAYIDFFLLDYKPFLAARLRGHWPLPPAADELLTRAAGDSGRELERAIAVSCGPESDFLEALSILPFKYFQEQTDESEQFAYLDAYCDRSWGQTPVRQLEAWGEVLGTAAFVAGILPLPFIGQAASTALLVVAAGLEATSFGSRALRGAHQHRLENAISHHDQATLSLKLVANHINAALAVLAPLGIAHYGRALRTLGWQALLPALDNPIEAAIYLAYMGVGIAAAAGEFHAQGNDPLGADSGDMLAFIAQSHLDGVLYSRMMPELSRRLWAGAFGQFAELSLRYVTRYMLLSFASDHVMQSVAFLGRGTESDPRIAAFRVKWLTSGVVVDRSGMILAISPLQEKFLTGSGSLMLDPRRAVAAAATHAITFAWQWAMTFLYSKAFVRWLNNDCGDITLAPWDWRHLADFRWPSIDHWSIDLGDLWFQSKTPDRPACQQAMNEALEQLALAGYTPAVMRDLQHLAVSYAGREQPLVDAELRTQLAAARALEARLATGSSPGEASR
jgi:hypothetical protein